MKKGKRKVQGVPQSQAAALPRHQEADGTDMWAGSLYLGPNT